MFSGIKECMKNRTDFLISKVMTVKKSRIFIDCRLFKEKIKYSVLSQ